MLQALTARPKRWAALTASLTLSLFLLHYFHWDDRALHIWQSSEVSSQQQLEKIWLPDYHAVIENQPISGLAEAETSGLTWNPQTNTLFTVTGQQAMLVELSLSGEILRSVDMQGFHDLEAVTVLGDGRFAVVEERPAKLSIFSLPAQASSINAEDVFSMSLGAARAHNKGFEGIAWDELNQRLLLAKERDPLGLFSLPFTPDTDSKLSKHALQELPSKHIFARDFSGLAIDPRTAHWLVLSDESRMLLEMNEEGETVSFMSFLAGFNGLTRSINQAEGVAIDAQGTIYVVSEPNLFYVFKRKTSD